MNDDNYSVSPVESQGETSRQTTGSCKPGRLITGNKYARANGFRLSDIGKLIEHRHGGWCLDPEWSRIYFLAALPQIISSRARYRDAVRAWVREWVPALDIVADDWIEDQISRCAEKEPARRCPRTDKLARLLRVEQHEVEAADLCAIPAVSRPKKVRVAEAKVKRAERDHRRYADENPGSKPHKFSNEQVKPWNSEGISRATWYARRKKLAEADPITTECADTFVKDAPNSATTRTDLDCFSPHIPAEGLGLFFTAHLTEPEAPGRTPDSEAETADGDVATTASTSAEREAA